ncbi:MAG: hypothetical protein KDI71_10965 [Xanthomonadales bacterium]|nr:hypothetical protein [Xanthomonadales bacterium]
MTQGIEHHVPVRFCLALGFFLAHLLLTSGAHAQSTMTVDANCAFSLSPSTTTPAVQINPQTGNVTVNSQSGVNCSTPSATLSVPPSVALNTSFTVTWNSNGTTSCDMTGGTPGWAASGRSTAGSTSLIAPPTPQTVLFGLSCNTAGPPVTDSKSIIFAGEGGVNLIVPASVQLGAAFTISWTSTGTISCTPTGGAGTDWASQQIGTAGNLNLLAPTTEGSVTFGITCNTGSGTITDSESIVFIGDGCGAGLPLPPGISGFAQQTWSTLYGAQFPLVYSTNRTFSVSSGQGLRLALSPTLPTNGDSPNGTLTYNEASAVARAGFMTISRCPGDFRIAVLNQPPGCDGVFTPCTNRCHTGPEASGQLSLSFRLQGSANNVCNMTPGLPYYVNIHFGGTTKPGPEGAFCAGAQCAIIGGTQAFYSQELQALKWIEGDMLGITQADSRVTTVPISALTVTPEP